MRKIKEAVSSVGDKIRIDMLLDALQGKDISNLTIIFGTCKDCKHWKDSDGVYRRGIGAESKCPVNNSRVFEGKFCCADFEKRGNKVGWSSLENVREKVERGSEDGSN